MENETTKVYVYGYGTCNFYRVASKLAQDAKKKGLIELELRRFIDSATYFTWLKENKKPEFHGDHETSPMIWAESTDSKKEFIGGCLEFHTYMKEKYNHGTLE
jgi:hypothetical protein